MYFLIIFTGPVSATTPMQMAIPRHSHAVCFVAQDCCSSQWKLTIWCAIKLGPHVQS
jgi:hypothetical protein